MKPVDGNAQQIAQWAYEEVFSSRRGTGSFKDQPWVYIYDSNPYGDDPRRRSREHSELCRALEADRIRLLGRGKYPTTGEDADYTAALIFDAADFLDPSSAEAVVREAWKAILARNENGVSFDGHPARLVSLKGGNE